MVHTNFLKSSRSQPLQEYVTAPDLGTYRPSAKEKIANQLMWIGSDFGEREQGWEL